MCARPIEHEHGHLVDIQDRRLLCTCRPCYLLFTQSGAARGRLRAVPERYRRAAHLVFDDESWSRLQIPVRTAFFFVNSQAGRVMAFYPSPAGATESLLGLDAWEEIVQENPDVAALEPDVEALLVHGRRGAAVRLLSRADRRLLRAGRASEADMAGLRRRRASMVRDRRLLCRAAGPLRGGARAVSALAFQVTGRPRRAPRRGADAGLRRLHR